MQQHGAAATHLNCLSSPSPVRDDDPAATITTPDVGASPETTPASWPWVGDADDGEALRRLAPAGPRGDVRGAHSHLGRLRETALHCDTGRISHPGRVPNEERHRAGSAPVVHRRRDAAATARSAAGSPACHAADDVQEDVELRERTAGALVEHREQQRERRRQSPCTPAAACRTPPWRPVPGSRGAPGASPR